MTPRFSRLLKKSESAIVWISARPAVTPYQKLPNPHSEVGLDCHRQTACGVSSNSAVRASRGFFQQPVRA